MNYNFLKTPKMYKSKLSTFIILSLFLIGCKSEISTFEGVWYDNDTETKVITIERFDVNYSLKTEGQTFSVIKSESTYNVQVRDKKYPLSYSHKENEILYQGKKYIPLEKTISYMLNGRWKSYNYDNTYLFQFDKDKIIRIYGQPLIIEKNANDTIVTFTEKNKRNITRIEVLRVENDTVVGYFWSGPKYGNGDMEEMGRHYRLH